MFGATIQQKKMQFNFFFGLKLKLYSLDSICVPCKDLSSILQLVEIAIFFSTFSYLSWSWFWSNFNLNVIRISALFESTVDWWQNFSIHISKRIIKLWTFHLKYSLECIRNQCSNRIEIKSTEKSLKPKKYFYIEFFFLLLL